MAREGQGYPRWQRDMMMNDDNNSLKILLVQNTNTNNFSTIMFSIISNNYIFLSTLPHPQDATEGQFFK